MLPELSTPAIMSFCEAALPGLIQHPAETWTNAGPLCAGIWILQTAKRDQLPQLRGLGWVAIFLAICSALYHASGLRIFEIMDLASMFAYIFVLLGLALNRARLGKKTFGHAAFAGAMLMAVGLCLLVPASGIVLFAVTTSATVAVELRVLRRRPGKLSLQWLGASVLAVGVGFAAWLADTQAAWCDPGNHLLSLHGVWHLMNSLPFIFLYRHYAALFTYTQPSYPFSRTDIPSRRSA